MKLVEKIKSVFKNESKVETEKFVIAQKSCPHCASRGMFIFKNNSRDKNDKTTEK